jgi:hypothetical protein
LPENKEGSHITGKREDLIKVLLTSKFASLKTTIEGWGHSLNCRAFAQQAQSSEFNP